MSDASTKVTAVLVVDMQERYFQEGKPLHNFRHGLTQAIKKLLEKAREQKWFIYFTKEEFKPDFSDAPLVQKKFSLPDIVEGSPLADIVEEFSDYKNTGNVIVKKRHSSFEDTDLREKLDENGVTDLVITGINTDSCILSACLGARMDYDVIVPRECVYSSNQDAHKVAMELLSHKVTVSSLDELVEG